MLLNKNFFLRWFLCVVMPVFVLCDAYSATEPVFTVTTIPMNARVGFYFNISAQGIFSVDCGENGILSGPGVTGGTIINRSSITTNDTYRCIYTAAGTNTISFYGGAGNTATGYNTSSNIAAISFKNNSYIESIHGDLSAVFPDLGPNNDQKPKFYETFSGCTNLTTVPSTLFSSINIGTQRMFYGTFSGCTNLTTIEPGVFANITVGSNIMFGNTFSGCTKLEQLPSGLFASITTGASFLFQDTFKGCTKLQTIPSNLFAGITTGVSSMFYGTFSECSALEVIPSGLFANITTGAIDMFHQTFYKCNRLTTIPSNLFAGITTGISSMFYGTFSRCLSIETLPSNLFSNITTGADSLFEKTFKGCVLLQTIPSNLFAGITSGGTNMFSGTFSDCSKLREIPEDFRFGGGNISGYENMFDNTFFYCSNLKKLPSHLFDNITSGADSMFKETFSHCINLVGYIPPTLFEKLTPRNSIYPANMMSGIFASTALDEQCPSGTTEYTTGYEGSTYGWGNKVSCKTTSYTVEYSCGSGSGSAPGNTIVSENVSFTPEVNTCTSPSADKIFVGWAVSGTGEPPTMVQPGIAFEWTYGENKTLTAQWGCDNANNWWWNADNTACVQGYTITLSVNSGLPQPDYDTEPTVIYTIPTRGAYLDAERTLLMTENENPITPPQKFFTTEYDANAPINPVTNEHYDIVEISASDFHYNYHCFLQEDNVCRIASTGYITNQGMDDAQNIYENQHWFVSAGGTSEGGPKPKPTLAGYTCTGWYTSADDTGSLVTYFSTYIHPPLLYAHWRPNTYNITYELNGGIDGSNHPGYATFDVPFNVSVPSRDGYTFVGWNITGMDGVTHYYGNNNQVNLYSSFNSSTLNNVTETWFMNLRSTSGTVTFTAIWRQNNVDSNTVNLNWIVNGEPYLQNQSSCIYGNGTINGISHEEIPGWTFTGWTVTNWE